MEKKRKKMTKKCKKNAIYLIKKCPNPSVCAGGVH